LIELIRTSFPGKTIEITVVEEDANDYLKSSNANEAHINEAIKRIDNNEGLVSVDFSSNE
jgi:hypothetical protein